MRFVKLFGYRYRDTTKFIRVLSWALLMPVLRIVLENNALLVTEWWEAKGLKDRALRAFYLKRMGLLWGAIRTGVKGFIKEETPERMVLLEEGSEAEIQKSTEKLNKFFDTPFNTFAKDNPQISGFLHDRVVRMVMKWSKLDGPLIDYLERAGIKISWSVTNGLLKNG
jgi:hypothetical protein